MVMLNSTNNTNRNESSNVLSVYERWKRVFNLNSYYGLLSGVENTKLKLNHNLKCLYDVFHYAYIV